MVTLIKFMGATVYKYNASVGWNEQLSTVTISLVEDLVNGDSFTPPGIGEPVVFQMEGHKFEGILQQYTTTGDISGNPLYEVMLTSPNEILAGAQVILGSFRGATGAMPNLINAFGHWDHTLGFSGTLTNESGMIWQAPFEIINVSTEINQPGSIEITPVALVGIKPAIEYLTNFSTDYGGPLLFRGHFYNVDLSSLPIPPSYYRLGGVSRDILSIVSEICEDGGHDYICYLEGHTIKFRTVSRIFQQEVGAIGNYINSRQDVSSKSFGYELRNDVTNAVLLGGDIRQLHQIYNFALDETIWPYWGNDPVGQVIVGTGQPEVWHEFNLNAEPIADIIGDTAYPCTIPELRLAQINFDSWAAWVLRHEPLKAQVINLVGAIDSSSELLDIFGEEAMQRDLIDARDEAAEQFGSMNESEYWAKRAQRVYEFVSTYANDYYGRKFLVKLPFPVYWKAVPETGQIITSEEPSDSGYLPEGSQPLGLTFLNEDAFMEQDGQFQCFAFFAADENIDIQSLNPANAVVQSNGVYVRARVDQSAGIVYPGGSILPYCVVELEDAVVRYAPDPLGGIDDIGAVIGKDNEPLNMLTATGLRNGDFPIKIAPPAYRPYGIALPIKSNRDSYGPWGTFPPWGDMGAPGKVSFDRDEELTPWNYGGIDTMNLAASSKLAGLANNMQVAETGVMEQVGSPTISLGDALISGGPEVTGIDTSFGVDGIKTTYRMQTFSPRFGVFQKGNAERLKRMGIAAQQVRRALRTLFHNKDRIQQTLTRASVGFMANTSRAVQQMTPHDMLYGRMAWSTQLNRYRTLVSTSTYPEAVANCRADNDDLWKAAAAMSMEGLLRPFSTDTDNENKDMPHYEEVVAGISPTGIPCVKTLDPLGEENDIDIISWEDKYPGEMHTVKAQYASDNDIIREKTGEVMDPPTYDNARMLGLRGPLVVVGWGYEYTGKPFPNQAVITAIEADTAIPAIQNWDSTFAEKHRQMPEYWKAGPVDLRFDTWRQCWTIPTFLIGTLDAAMTSGPTKMTIKAGGTAVGGKVDVHNMLGGTTIPINSTVYAGYYPLDNKWYVIAAPCS